MKSSQIFLDGHLGKPAESKQTEKGDLMTKFQLAVKVWGKEQPLWMPILAFKKIAEIAQNLQAGDRIQVWGRLDHFQVNNGQRPMVKADDVVILKKKNPEEKQENNQENWGF